MQSIAKASGHPIKINSLKAKLVASSFQLTTSTTSNPRLGGLSIKITPEKQNNIVIKSFLVKTSFKKILPNIAVNIGPNYFAVQKFYILKLDIPT